MGPGQKGEGKFFEYKVERSLEQLTKETVADCFVSCCIQGKGTMHIFVNKQNRSTEISGYHQFPAPNWNDLQDPKLLASCLGQKG